MMNGHNYVGRGMNKGVCKGEHPRLGLVAVACM